jgi:hypothetical protein
MCVYSAVFDHYGPRFDRWTKPASPSVEPIPEIDLNIFAMKDAIEELKQLIKEFKEAAEHAKKLDTLMQKPDCEDPDKAKLLGRIAELEKAIAQLQKPKKKTKK